MSGPPASLSRPSGAPRQFHFFDAETSVGNSTIQSLEIAVAASGRTHLFFGDPMDGTIRVFDRNLRRIRDLEAYPNGTVTHLKLALAANRLFSVGDESREHVAVLQQWDLNSGARVGAQRLFHPDKDPAPSERAQLRFNYNSSLKLNLKGNSSVSGSSGGDTEAEAFAAAAQQQATSDSLYSCVSDFDVTEDGKQFALGLANGEVLVGFGADRGTARTRRIRLRKAPAGEAPVFVGFPHIAAPQTDTSLLSRFTALSGTVEVAWPYLFVVFPSATILVGLPTKIQDPVEECLCMSPNEAGTQKQSLGAALGDACFIDNQQLWVASPIVKPTSPAAAGANAAGGAAGRGGAAAAAAAAAASSGATDDGQQGGDPDRLPERPQIPVTVYNPLTVLDPRALQTGRLPLELIGQRKPVLSNPDFFDGEKLKIGMHRGYVFLLTRPDPERKPDKFVFTLIDEEAHIRAVVPRDSLHQNVAWVLPDQSDILLILQEPRQTNVQQKVVRFSEVNMQSKLDQLFRKEFYSDALKIVQKQRKSGAAGSDVASQGKPGAAAGGGAAGGRSGAAAAAGGGRGGGAAGAGVSAAAASLSEDELLQQEVEMRYGDHLFTKGRFSEAIEKYINAIRRVDPSVVIRKFLDVHRIADLTKYLEALHRRDLDLANENHTTLLVNCLAKSDMQLLTDRGWMGYTDAKAAYDAGTLVVAGFDQNTKSLVYESPSSFIDIRAPPESGMYLLHNSHANISLRITGDHNLLVTPNNNNSPSNPTSGKIVKASVLQLLAGKWPGRKGPFMTRDTNVRLVSYSLGLENGIDTHVSVKARIPELANMCRNLDARLRPEQTPQTQTFMEIYGFWLGDGSISFGRSVCFARRKPSDIDFICTRLDQLGLILNVDYTRTPAVSNNTTIITLLHPAWTAFFFAESDSVKSASKWFAEWVWQLGPQHCAAILRGLSEADGLSTNSVHGVRNTERESGTYNCVYTSSVPFRDAVERLCLHAGFTTMFALDYKAGAVRGKNPDGTPIVATADAWRVHYSRAWHEAAPTITQSKITKVDDYNDGTWCVSMPRTGNIVVRRHTGVIDDDGYRPVIIGNCLAKLKDEKKLQEFIDRDEFKFDARNAIAVCRQANYFEPAKSLARKYREHSEYINILLDNTKEYAEAVRFIKSMSMADAWRVIADRGKLLIDRLPRQATECFRELICSGFEGGKAVSANHGDPGLAERRVAAASFIPLFVDTPFWLHHFLRYIVEKLYTANAPPPVAAAVATDDLISGNDRPKATEATATNEIFNTLLELLVAKDIPERLAVGQAAVVAADGNGSITDGNNSSSASLDTLGSGAASAAALAAAATGGGGGAIMDQTVQPEARRRRAVEVLQRYHGHYDAYHALVLAHQNNFEEGVLLLLQQLDLHGEVFGFYAKIFEQATTIEQYRNARQKLEETCIERQNKARSEAAAAGGASGAGGNAANSAKALWVSFLALLLRADAQRFPDVASDVTRVLQIIASEDLLPPVAVIELLSTCRSLPLRAAKQYVLEAIQRQQKTLETADVEVQRLETLNNKVREDLVRLSTTAMVFQATKCFTCGEALELPVVHFLCRHAYHKRCLNDPRECNECGLKNRRLVQRRREQEEAATDHEAFFAKLRDQNGKTDLFSVVAQQFGMGVFSTTTTAAGGAAAPGAAADKPKGAFDSDDEDDNDDDLINDRKAVEDRESW